MELTVDEVGTYLEHCGYSNDEIDEFIAHFGIKGMKWGTRHKISEKGNVYQQRSFGSKATIVGGAIAGNVIASKVGAKLVKGDPKKLPLVIAASGAGALLGARAARTMVDKASKTPAKELGLKGKHLGDKGLTKNEKAYATYIGFTVLATAGMLKAAETMQKKGMMP